MYIYASKEMEGERRERWDEGERGEGSGREKEGRSSSFALGKQKSRRLWWRRRWNDDVCDRVQQLNWSLMPSSQRHTRHDKTVLSVSCPVCRCEFDDCSERVQTSNFLSATVLSCRESSSHRRSGRDTDKTVWSCLAWWRCDSSGEGAESTSRITLYRILLLRNFRITDRESGFLWI